MKTCLSGGSVGEVLKTSHLTLCTRTARSPNIIVCDFFWWGYVKNKVYVSPLPANTDDMKNRITAAINMVGRDMLRLIWEEFSNRLDVARAASGGHIEHL